MTQKQRENFCDNYCKFLADSNYRLKYYKGTLDMDKYLDALKNEHHFMATACDSCPLNEVTDE